MLNYYLNPEFSHLKSFSLLIINTTTQSSITTTTTTNKPPTITMESIKQGVNYVAETVQQATAGASKEANKEVAKDGNAPISTRYVASPSIQTTTY